MTFTTKADREKMDKLTLEQLAENPGPKVLGIDVKPGDRCFKEYERIMKMWRQQPRWTTVDEIFKDLIQDDQERAHFLAMLVFFCKEAMPYELERAKENGEV